MTNWWIVVNVPGWMASSLYRLPEASSVPSYRGMTRYTDNTIEVIENVTGVTQTYGIRVITDEECSLRHHHTEYPCYIRQIEKGHARNTSGEVTALNTKYWNVFTADGTFQVHKTMHDEEDGPAEWTIEMLGNVSDADALIRVIRKYISH